MMEEQEMLDIDKGSLIERVARLRASGYRLVQICPTTQADGYEMNYSFDRDLRFVNLRFNVAPGETVPSISLLYWNAFLYENEIHDLFGITIEDMAIDYRGTLYRTAIPSPFSVDQVKRAAAAGQVPKTGRPKETEGNSTEATGKEGNGG